MSPLVLAANPATNRVYVGNLADANLSVIDGLTDTVARSTIALGSKPTGIAINPVTNRIYTADFEMNTVTVVDAAAQRVLGSPIKVGQSPQPIAVNTRTNRVYVASLNDASVDSGATVTVIDGDTSSIIGQPIEVARTPRGIGVDPTTNRVYVSGDVSNAVTMIDGATNTVMGAPVQVGKNPQSIAVNPTTHRVYVANADDGTVSVINSVTNAIVGAPIAVGNRPGGVAVNPALDLVYVTNSGSNNVSVIDGATSTVVGSPITVMFPSIGIDVLPATGRVYVSEPFNNRVNVIGVPLTIDGSVATSVDSVPTTWSNLFVPNGGDFIGLFELGAPDASPLSRRFTNGTATAGGAGRAEGSVDLPIPAGLVAGRIYEARLVSGQSRGTIARVETARLAVANDSYTVGPNATLNVPAPGVLANDSDPRSSALRATVVTNPAHGTVRLHAADLSCRSRNRWPRPDSSLGSDRAAAAGFGAVLAYLHEFLDGHGRQHHPEAGL